MKKTHISVSLLVFILSLTIAGVANQNFTAQYNLEAPKWSAGEISIITPENKTYIEPMNGYYPGTYGFENDGDGTVPEGWATYEGGGTVNVINEVGNHKKVLELHSDAVTDNLNAYIDFNEQEYGTVEFWLRSDDVTKDTTFQLFNSGTGHGICTVMLSNDRIRYYNGSFQTTSYIPLDNTWYYFRIDFETTNGGYEGLSQWRWKFYYSGDDIWLDDLSFANNEKPSRTYLNSYWADTNYDLYFDAIGYSWDSNYNIGDNLNEGLLLSFDNTTTLDWQGYSMDGATNKIILGNTTIPMPAEGLHRVQVFGNDSIGTMYESDVRYFTINLIGPHITINSPISSQIYGIAPPDFSLSTPDSDLDIRWYTIDGITNITFTGLTGTIDQTEWDKIWNGTATITFYANDTLNNIGQAEVMVRKDIIKPIIAIIGPNNAEEFEFTPIYEITISETNLLEYWYTIDGGAHNYTITELVGTIDSGAWNSTSAGPITIRFYANDSAGNIGTSFVIVVKITSETLPPTPPGIPGYDLYLLIGVLTAISALLIRKRLKS